MNVTSMRLRELSSATMTAFDADEELMFSISTDCRIPTTSSEKWKREVVVNDRPVESATNIMFNSHSFIIAMEDEIVCISVAIVSNVHSLTTTDVNSPTPARSDL